MLKAYGVLGANGLPERVTVIVGPDGNIRMIDGTVNAQFSGPATGRARLSQHGENLSLLLSDWKGRLGTRVPNFFLPDLNGKTVSPMLPGKKATVIVFLSSRCPVSRAQISQITDLAANPVYHQVSFLAIAPNTAEKPEELRAFSAAYRLSFPIALDRFQEVTERMEVAVTPSVWVLNGRGTVVYRGALASTRSGSMPVNLVQEALNAVLTGRPVAVAESTPVGTKVTPSLPQQ